LTESDHIEYCSGYKYQLRKDVWFQTGIKPGFVAASELVTLHIDGWLHIRKYYAWDGCSGPAWDDHTNMRACLIHDALYYLMRIGELDASFKGAADSLLSDFMRRDGAWPIRAYYYELAVGLCGQKNVCADSVRVVYSAP
jgi:hypothetical protein